MSVNNLVSLSLKIGGRYASPRTVGLIILFLFFSVKYFPWRVVCSFILDRVVLKCTTLFQLVKSTGVSEFVYLEKQTFRNCSTRRNYYLTRNRVEKECLL